MFHRKVELMWFRNAFHARLHYFDRQSSNIRIILQTAHNKLVLFTCHHVNNRSDRTAHDSTVGSHTLLPGVTMRRIMTPRVPSLK